MRGEKLEVTRGSGNVFRDLGRKNADAEQFKAILAAEIIKTLDREPGNKSLAWRYGIDETVLDPRIRTTEIANWITHQVLPGRTKRGRA